MVVPTILKRKHNMKGGNLLPVLKKIRNPTTVKAFARVSSAKKTEDMSLEEVKQSIQDPTGEEPDDLLAMAGKEGQDIEAARLMLHFIIILSNEKGQPRGQDLIERGAQARPGPSKVVQTVQGSDNDSDSDLESVEQPTKKMRKTSPISSLKERVRILCLQNKPSDNLILLTLEEMVREAKKHGNEEGEFYEELLRQIHRMGDKVNIPNLCLSVMGGGTADKISRAIAKSIRTEEPVKENKVNLTHTNEKPAVSPLENVYPPHQLPQQFNPYSGYPIMAYPTGYPQPPFQYGGYRRFRTRMGYPQGQRKPQGQGSRGACFACESTEHQMKDCPKLKAIRQNRN